MTWTGTVLLRCSEAKSRRQSCRSRFSGDPSARRASVVRERARSRVHRDAIAEMYRQDFEYTHYAALWQPVAIRPRHAFCDNCGAENVMPAEYCAKCGNELVDVFVIQNSGEETVFPA